MFFLRFCLFWGVVLGFLPLLQGIEPRVAAIDAFALQFAVGNVVLVLALIVFRRRLISWRWWAIAGLAGAAYSAATVWPELAFRYLVPAGGPVLRVVNVNIRFDNRDLSKLVDYLSAESPDIVGLVEATAQSKAVLAALKAVYPYSVDCVGQNSVCQAILLSKLPLHRSYAGPIGDSLTYVAEGEIVWQGHSVVVTVTHIPPPAYLPYTPEGEANVSLLPGTAALWQSQQAAVLARALSAPTSEPVARIVLGDFNSAPWSPLQRAFRAATGLENRGTWAPSWPSWHPFFARIPIDPVFTGGALAIRHLNVGPDVGSDHLPVEAEIAVKPE